jgi:hypothetical protein
MTDIFSMTDIFKCHYCGLIHKRVEAGGIYYCPNTLCLGPGAAYFRSTCKSYKEDRWGKHTVDTFELVGKALLELEKETDPEIRTKIVKSAIAWLSDDS